MEPRHIELLVERLGFAEHHIKASQPSDGYLHQTWFVESEGRRVVFKHFDRSLFGDLTVAPEHLVRNTALAGDAGVGAKVLCIDEGADVIILERLEGVPLTESDVLEPENMLKVARALRQLHDTKPLPANRVDFLKWSDRWLSSLQAIDSAWVPALLASQAELASVRAVVETVISPDVFIHNDLLPANLISTPTGLSIIDYDFSGRGSRYFDLGCIFANCDFDDESRERFMSAYLGEASEEELDRALVYEVLALHANAIVFAWANHGYPHKFSAIAEEMDAAVEGQLHSARKRLALPRVQGALDRLSPSGSRP